MSMVSKIGEGDGGAVFRVNKLCGRCEYTNVDPETGTKVPRGEVHKVSQLSRFRPAFQQPWKYLNSLL